MAKLIKNSLPYRAALALGLLAALLQVAAAGQGCPFDDGSCQEYCGQQGCQMGYCGSFAWIQCICRRCGDEWNWYDKVRYNPDKTVNQTELDSLKLNGSAPLILTNSDAEHKPAAGGKQQVVVLAGAAKTTQRPSGARQQEPQEKPATLTTLLIPDLSDPTKLDLNDIPDENSEKFLDFLAKNHEKLAQATSARGPGEPQTSQKSTSIELVASDDSEPAEPEDEDDRQSGQSTTTTTSTTTSTTTTTASPTSTDNEETVEIQFSSSSNSNEQQQQAGAGQVTRLLRMAVAERTADELEELEVE